MNTAAFGWVLYVVWFIDFFHPRYRMFNQSRQKTADVNEADKALLLLLYLSDALDEGIFSVEDVQAPLDENTESLKETTRKGEEGTFTIMKLVQVFSINSIHWILSQSHNAISYTPLTFSRTRITCRPSPPSLRFRRTLHTVSSHISCCPS